MASPSTVLTLGFGTFGDVNEVVTLGYGTGAAVAPGSLPTVDTFTGADGTGLTGRSPDQGAGRWRVVRGTAEVLANAAYAGDNVAEHLAVIDVGASDFVCSLDFASNLATESHTFVVVRYADENNFWAVRNAVGFFHICEITGGVLTIRASGFVAGSAHPLRLRVTCAGDTITAQTLDLDGTARGDPISYESATAHNDATAVGFWVMAGGTTAYFDDLNVTELPEPPAPAFRRGLVVRAAGAHRRHRPATAPTPPFVTTTASGDPFQPR